MDLLIEDLDDPAFDPTDHEDAAFGDVLDPWPMFREVASQGPVVRGEYRMLFSPDTEQSLAGLDHYMVFGPKEISEAYTDAELFSAERVRETNHKRAFGRTLSAMDPPDHTRYRRVFQAAFSPKALEKWRNDVVRPVIHELIDKMAGKDRAELVTDFTGPYPFEIVYRQLGLPAEDSHIFHKLALTQTMHPTHMSLAIEAGEKLGRFIERLLGERRKNPGDDLISVLASAEIEGEQLPDAVLIPFFRHVLNAAGDTTFRCTGSLLTALLTNVDQLGAVRADRSLIKPAVDEALRWEGPIVATSRMNIRDVELGGVHIPAGSVLHLIQGAANHDERTFANPDSYDLHRGPAGARFAFASGRHLCLGMHLARMEMCEALDALLDRFPKLRLDGDFPAPEIRGFNFRGPKQIHVRLN